MSGYLITFIFALFSFSSLYVKEVQTIFSFKYWPVAGPVYNLYLIFGYISFAIYGCYTLFKSFKSSYGYRREQIKYVLLGSVIGWSGGAYLLSWMT